MSENTSLPAPENTNPVEILAGGPTAFAVRDIHQPPADPLTINQSPIDRSAVGQSSVGTGEYLPSALKTEDPIMVVGLQFATVRRAVK